MPGGGKGSLTLVFPVEHSHPALGRRHSGNSSVAGLVKPGSGGDKGLIK